MEDPPPSIFWIFFRNLGVSVSEIPQWAGEVIQRRDSGNELVGFLGKWT